MMEQVRLCAVWPAENWIGSSINHLQGRMTVLESYCHALEKGCLTSTPPLSLALSLSEQVTLKRS